MILTFFDKFNGFPMGSDPAPFFANLFLFRYKSEWIDKMKIIDHHCPRLGQVRRFIYR